MVLGRGGQQEAERDIRLLLAPQFHIFRRHTADSVAHHIAEILEGIHGNAAGGGHIPDVGINIFFAKYFFGAHNNQV